MTSLSFAAVCLLFGSNFYLMSIALEGFGPATVGAGRIVGAIAVLMAIWRTTAPDTRLRRRDILPAVLIGLLANGYPAVVQPYLIQQTEAASRGGGHSFYGVMVAFTPLLTILVSIPLLGVRPTWRQAVGVAAGLGFMGLLLRDGQKLGVTAPMLLLAISVPTAYAVANTYLRRRLAEAPAVPLTVAMLAAPTVILTTMAVWEWSSAAAPPTQTVGPAAQAGWPATAPVAALLWLGTMGTGLVMWVFVRLVQSRGPLFAGMVTYVVPLIALGWGVRDGELITTRQQIAVAGVLAMVALVQYGGPRRAADAAEEAPRGVPHRGSATRSAAST